MVLTHFYVFSKNGKWYIYAGKAYVNFLWTKTLCGIILSFSNEKAYVVNDMQWKTYVADEF